MLRRRRIVQFSLVGSLLLMAACSGTGGSGSNRTPTSTTVGDPNTDKLAAILARGTLVLSTDLEYPPQSYPVEGADPTANSACSPNQLTADEVTGYDAEMGKLVSERLGVEPCFVEPTWTAITGGNWADRWDISWGSGGINSDRMTRLYMTQPYYATPQSFFVREHSPFEKPSDLDGKEIGVCAACTHELYLQGGLEVPGVEIEQKVRDPEIVVFDVEPPGLKAVAKGEIAAFLLSEPVGMQAVEEGLALRPLEEPAFPLYLTGFVDQSSSLDQEVFISRVNEIVSQLHADGALVALSEEFFGTDYATAASEFDLDAIGQSVE
jgi:polar amino acid transport system substrate-binding protein